MAKANSTRSKKSAAKAGESMASLISRTESAISSADSTIDAMLASLCPLFDQMTTDDEHLVIVIEALAERAKRQLQDALEKNHAAGKRAEEVAS